MGLWGLQFIGQPTCKWPIRSCTHPCVPFGLVPLRLECLWNKPVYHCREWESGIWLCAHSSPYRLLANLSFISILQPHSSSSKLSSFPPGFLQGKLLTNLLRIFSSICRHRVCNVLCSLLNSEICWILMKTFFLPVLLVLGCLLSVLTTILVRLWEEEK